MLGLDKGNLFNLLILIDFHASLLSLRICGPLSFSLMGLELCGHSIDPIQPMVFIHMSVQTARLPRLSPHTLHMVNLLLSDVAALTGHGGRGSEYP